MPFDATPSHPTPAPGLDPGVALQLPADAYYQLVHTLRLALPPPLTDTPDDLRRRDHAAIARIAALCPANAAEADLAAHFVAASEQWKNCLRLAQERGAAPEWAAKCRAQALRMMRQSTSALRLLLHLQAARQKRDADSAACNSAAWTEHCAIGLMSEALAHGPHPNPLPEGEGEGATSPLPPGEGQGEGQAAISAPAVPQPAPAPPIRRYARPDTGSKPQLTPAPLADSEPRSAACPEPESAACPGPRSGIAEAEEYAAIYPERAALIRRLGRLPADVSFGPPEDDLVQALVTARTPALAALDREFAHSG